MQDLVHQLLAYATANPPVVAAVLGGLIALLVVMLTSEGPNAKSKSQLRRARSLLTKLCVDIDCMPILVRAAWHDSGTYDKNNSHKAWPDAGGAVGSIRTEHEITAGPNAGLSKAVTKYLGPIKKQCPLVSWADLIQLGSATAIEVAGGPKIPMRYGRLDGTPSLEGYEPPFGLPDGRPPFGGDLKDDHDPAEHLRYVFYKYGMDDKDIVTLSGAHTIGRAFKQRSGAVEQGYGDGTAYTKKLCPFLGKSQQAGGASWTKNWLVFDNSYYSEMAKKDPECFAFPTDEVLMTDPGFKPHFDTFAADQAAFFAAYQDSHKRLSELGAKFSPPGGIFLD